MTCEVAVLNKYAVVLAADSAVTTTNGEGERRYSKGGNKIFQLSHTEPVGTMIFASAAICGMPWEVVIKAYRAEHLQSNKFDSVEEYAENFFSFLHSAVSPISADMRSQSLVAGLKDAALRVMRLVAERDAATMDATLAANDRAARVASALGAITTEIEAIPFDDERVKSEAERVCAAPPQELQDFVDEGLRNSGLSTIFSTNPLVQTACKLYFRSYGEFLASTGVVFAGYGKLEYFPSVIEYSVSGFVGNQLVYGRKDVRKISVDAPSDILPFATTSMVESFMRGVGLDVFVKVATAYKQFASAFASAQLARAGAQEPATLEADVETSTQEFTASWYGEVLSTHYEPLKRVIASLPVEEMTHLAETLVTLESLKERVTTPKQSVGGPIDVAVITKSEGLVWIKRKHFFDSDKNLRFILRQRAIFQ